MAGYRSATRAEASARRRLTRFRQASRLAIGATALLLFLAGTRAPGEGAGTAISPGALDASPAVAGDPAGDPRGGLAADPAGDLIGPVQEAQGPEAGEPEVGPVESGEPEPGEPETGEGDGEDPATQEETEAEDHTLAAEDPVESARRATGTLRRLGRSLYNSLPVIGIAIGLLLVAGVLARLVRLGLRAALSSWERAEATSALASILIWLLALGAALSVVAGDARALVGSIGLFGLALSWALQTPIESFTGWLLNSFRSYYRVGDRIAVGDVFGDVARIDFLTTTVFEAGGPAKRVQAAQSTGAMITFPNSEVLRSNITNFTRDFPFVWDELAVAVANESDIRTAVGVLERVAYDVVGERMEAAAEEYGTLLQKQRLAWDVATRPEVYASARDSWTDLTIRYVVPAREMRKWSSRLLMAVNEALADDTVAKRVHPAYPRNQVQPLPSPEWTTADTTSPAGEDE